MDIYVKKFFFAFLWFSDMILSDSLIIPTSQIQT